MTPFTRSLARPSTLTPHRVGRVRYSPEKIAWLYGVGALAVLGLPHVTWTRGLVAAGLGFLTACCGHSVGLHRGIIHRAFRMAPGLRRALLLLFCQTGLGGPLSWIRLHHVRDAWQSRPDTPAYFAYRHGLVADYVWNLHMAFEPADPADMSARYGVPRELERDPLLRGLEATWRLQVIAAFAAVWLSFGFGAAAVVVAGRVAVTILVHWFVGYASHVHGRRPFEIDNATEEGRDGWLLGAVSFGEGFHNTHHAMPRSARMGLGRWDLDLGFVVVRLFRRLGWVDDVVEPEDPRALKVGARRRRPRGTLGPCDVPCSRSPLPSRRPRRSPPSGPTSSSSSPTTRAGATSASTATP